MAKTKISEFNANPALNTDIDSINIAEGCSPSGINDAIRELMAQLKDWQSGTSNDPYVVGSSGSLTLNQGTANGVAYLNGSKVVTSGSALTFDGTTFTASGGSVMARFKTGSATDGRIEFAYNTTDIGYINMSSSSLLDIYARSGVSLAFGANASEQMRLTSTGLGIGTSSPASKLEVSGDIRLSGGNPALIGVPSSTAFYIDNRSTNKPIIFRTSVSSAADVEALTINSSGNLGLGVTPSAWGSSYKALEVGGVVSYFSSANQYFGMYANAYRNSGGSLIYTTTGVSSGYLQDLGSHKWFNAASGTAGNAITFTQAMTLDASGNLGVGVTSPSARLHVSGTSSVFSNPSGNFDLQIYQSGRYDGRISAKNSALEISQRQALPLIFLTSDTERARIDSSGNLLVGTTTTNLISTNTAGTVVKTGGGVQLMQTQNTSDWGIKSTSGSICNFYSWNGSAAVFAGSISVNGNVTSYTSVSDQRLKENIQDSDSASSLIDSLQVRKFDWKTDQTHQRYGFIAQELVTVAPEAVHQPEDTEQMMAVDYSKLVPMLVKEIQSLRQRVAQLESN